MAWNTPGNKDPDNNKSNDADKDRRQTPWPPKRGNSGGGGVGGGFGPLLDRLRGMFEGGGGSPWRWIGLALVIWLAFNCFVLIAEQQRGVVLRFGHFNRVMQPGPHFKLPWPIERVTKVEATRIQTYSDNVPILTSDENIVQVEINVQYRVKDPELYLFGSRDADEMLKQAVLSTVREQVGRSDLDAVLGARESIAVIARQQLQASLDAYRTGLFVTELNLPNARPPDEVKPAFDDVNSAQQDKDRLISESRAYAAKIVPEARGQAARVRTVAEGYKTAAIARATGDSERFTLVLDQYRGAPEVTRKRLWLETVQQVLAENRKVIGGDGKQLIYVPMSGQGGSGTTSAPPLLTPDLISPPVSATPSEPRPERSTRRGDEESSR